MKRPTRSEYPRLVEIAATGAAALLCAMVLLTLAARLLSGGGEVGEAVAAKADEKAAQGPLADAVKAVQERNPFSPPKPQGFQGQLTGILGDRAVFNGSQSAKVGENVMGAKVLAIGADWVEIEFEGATRKISLFAGGPGSGGSGRPGPPGGEGGPRPGERQRMERRNQAP